MTAQFPIALIRQGIVVRKPEMKRSVSEEGPQRMRYVYPPLCSFRAAHGTIRRSPKGPQSAALATKVIATSARVALLRRTTTDRVSLTEEDGSVMDLKARVDLRLGIKWV